MDALDYMEFNNSLEFRLWLGENYASCRGVWLVFYKKHTDLKKLEYAQALEEALCFGWIDSVVKRLDDDRYARKFTPRSNTKNWSDVNKKLVDLLIENGKMTEAGLMKIDSYAKTGKIVWESQTPVIHGESTESFGHESIIKTLEANEPALTNFNKLAPSHQKRYLYWISSAKRQETFQKRLLESVELLKNNSPLGLK